MVHREERFIGAWRAGPPAHDNHYGVAGYSFVIIRNWDMDMLNVRQLDAFRTIMLAGSVTQAAEQLHVSQPAVSQLLQQLESECGFLLFERRHNSMVPTREAEILYDEVDRVTDAVNNVRRIAMSLKEGKWGSIGIAGFPAFCHRLLPEIVAGYYQNRPDIEIVLESRRSRTLIDSVATRKLDVGVGLLPSDRDDVESHHLFQFSGVCVMPPEHRLAAQSTVQATDLADEHFVSLGSEDRSRIDIDRVFDQLHVPRRIHIEAPQSDIACAFVERGAGVSIVDPFSAYNAHNNLLARPFEPAISFDVWLLSPKTSQKLAVVDDFVGHLVERLHQFYASRMN